MKREKKTKKRTTIVEFHSISFVHDRFASVLFLRPSPTSLGELYERAVNGRPFIPFSKRIRILFFFAFSLFAMFVKPFTRIYAVLHGHRAGRRRHDTYIAVLQGVQHGAPPSPPCTHTHDDSASIYIHRYTVCTSRTYSS